MRENQMTEIVGGGEEIASVIGKDTLENIAYNGQNNEQTNLESGSETQGLEKSEKIGKQSTLDVERGIEILIGGTEDEIAEYFGSQGIPVCEILKERTALLNHVKDITYAYDLQELQDEFSFLTAKKIQEIPNFEKFSKLRASGLSAIESFEGASGKLISMEYLKNRDEFSYSHLKSTGLKGSVSGDIPIPKAEVAIWKSAFPNDTMTQLTKRYNKTKFN